MEGDVDRSIEKLLGEFDKRYAKTGKPFDLTQWLK